MLSAPATIERRMPSSVVACTATGRPGLCAAIGPPAVVGVDLDPVCATPCLLAYRSYRFGYAAYFLRPLLRAAQIRPKAARQRTVGAGRDDRACRHDKTRAGDEAVGNRLLERDVRKIGAFGAKVSQSGEAREQRGLRLF